MKLTEEQAQAVQVLVKHLCADDNDIAVLVGAAGTGKTVLTKALIPALEAEGRSIRLAAPTGKASSRLMQATKYRATTIHGMLYGSAEEALVYPREVDEGRLDVLLDSEELAVEPEDARRLVHRGAKSNLRYQDAIDGESILFDTRDLTLLKAGSVPENPYHPFWSPTSEDDSPERRLVFGQPLHAIQSSDVVIIDEASMVGQSLHTEIVNQMPDGAKLLYIGDKEQLLPVKDDPAVDMENPTFELTQIHRQAENSPIIQVATRVRQGRPLPFPRHRPGRRRASSAYSRTSASLKRVAEWAAEKISLDADSAVLCFRRVVRARINEAVRKALGYTLKVQNGDRLRVARTNRDLGVINGEIVTVLNVEMLGVREEVELKILTSLGRVIEARCQPNLIGEDGKSFSTYLYGNRALDGVDPDLRSLYLHFDYGYALTVHSAQGSEFDDVGFVVDNATDYFRKKNPDDARRLFYTATTRASQTLTVFDLVG